MFTGRGFKLGANIRGSINTGGRREAPAFSFRSRRTATQDRQLKSALAREPREAFFSGGGKREGEQEQSLRPKTKRPIPRRKSKHSNQSLGMVGRAGLEPATRPL